MKIMSTATFDKEKGQPSTMLQCHYSNLKLFLIKNVWIYFILLKIGTIFQPFSVIKLIENYKLLGEVLVLINYLTP